jgi:hypothetical protein
MEKPLRYIQFRPQQIDTLCWGLKYHIEKRLLLEG